MFSAGDLQIVESHLSGRREGSFLAPIMCGAEDKIIIAAGVRGAIRHTPFLDKDYIGVVTAGVGAIGRGAIGGSIDGRFDDVAVIARHVVVMKAILDFFWDAPLGAVVVMDLYEIPVLLAFLG